MSLKIMLKFISSFSLLLALFAPYLAAEAPSQSLARANLNFALKMHKEIRESGKNTFFSPFSISTALTMAETGAKGETKAEMKRTLATNQVSNLIDDYSKLISAINSRTSSESLQLETANSLWIADNLKINADYSAIIRDKFFSEANLSNYAADAEAERKRINDWVAKKTKDKIKDLIPQGTITELTRLIIVNAIYFYGEWATPFNPELTKEGDFSTSNTEKSKVSFMNLKDEFGYYEDDLLQAVNLPYIKGGISMLVVLPKSGETIGNLVTRFDAGYFEKINKDLKVQDVILKLPKFKLNSTYMLKNILIKLGMSLAFDSGKSDFSGIDPENNLLISEVVHKAFVEVNEKGSEAAAATAVVMVGRGLSVSEPQPARFIADRPFLFFILDKPTGTALFMGEMNKPA